MKLSILIPLSAAVAALPMTAALADHHEMKDMDTEMDMAKPVQAGVIDTAGKRIGSVTLTQTPNGVVVMADIAGLPAGEHGFHIHETGKCETSEKFSTAGGHYAPRGRDHGFMRVSGPHAGDMPNQFVGKDGRLRATVFNTRIELDHGYDGLMDADGSALVVHQGADDYSSQPSGAAGDRIACAVLAPPMQ